MNRSMLESPVAKGLIILIFLGAFAVWITWPRHLPPPDEANRVWHPDGYSIIRPAGWEGGAEPYMADPAMLGRISMRPQNPGLRHPSLSIINWRNQPDLKELKSKEQFVESTFLGKPALMFEGRWRGSWAERIIWQDQGRWFDLDLNIPIQEDIQHSAWWPYVTSFRYDPAKAKHASTAPTTVEFTPIFPTTQTAP